MFYVVSEKALIETEFLDLVCHLMPKQTGFQYLPCSVFFWGGGECKGGYTVISSFLWHICSQISLVVESSLITFLACFHKNITNGFSPGRFFRWAKSLPATSFTLRVCIALSIQQVVNVGKRRKVFEMSKKWVVLQPFDRSSLLVKWAVKVFVLPMTTYSVNR